MLPTALNGECPGAVFHSAGGAQLGQPLPPWTPAARAYSRRSGDEKGARWDMTSSKLLKTALYLWAKVPRQRMGNSHPHDFALGYQGVHGGW